MHVERERAFMPSDLKTTKKRKKIGTDETAISRSIVKMQFPISADIFTPTKKYIFLFILKYPLNKMSSSYKYNRIKDHILQTLQTNASQSSNYRSIFLSLNIPKMKHLEIIKGIRD